MCKHLLTESDNNACSAYPNGRTFDELFPYADEECGNGVRFEPNEKSKHLWDERMYFNFSRPTPEDLQWEVCVGDNDMSSD